MMVSENSGTETKHQLDIKSSLPLYIPLAKNAAINQFETGLALEPSEMK